MLKTNISYKKYSKARRIIPLCLCLLMGAIISLVSLTEETFAQSNDVLNRLKRIENEVDTLNRAVYKGEKRPVVSQESIDANANMEVRLSQIENELRNLTGKIEQQAYDNQQLQQQLEALTQDSRLRLDALEGQMRAKPIDSATSPQAMVDTNTVNPQNILPPTFDGNGQELPKILQPETTGEAAQVTGNEGGKMDAATLYEKGFGEIKANDYDAAEKTFATFVKDYPTHALAPNALYWLGETYYVRKNYDKASRTFAEAYQKYPNGPKGADNLLKLGMSLSAKGEKDNACIALGQLKKEYPTGPAPVLKRGDEEMATLGCR